MRNEAHFRGKIFPWNWWRWFDCALFVCVCVHRPGINILPVSCFVLLPHTISLQLSFPLFPPPSLLRPLLVLLSIHWKSQSFLISMFRCVHMIHSLTLSSSKSISFHLSVRVLSTIQLIHHSVVILCFSSCFEHNVCYDRNVNNIQNYSIYLHGARGVCVCVCLHNKPNGKVWIELSRVFVFAPKIKCLNMNCWLEAVIVIFGTPRPIQ